jgi:hypothetical protein
VKLTRTRKVRYLPEVSREGSACSPLDFRHGDKGAVALRRRLDYLTCM